MRLAVLSDCRIASNLDYPGHGLGRSAVRLSMGLARRGHDVTLFAGHGSKAEGCFVIEHGEELQRGEDLAALGQQFECYIDCSHQHKLAWLRPEWPIICKRNDKEGHAPDRRVYGSQLVKEWIADGDGIVIHEGVDIDQIPFKRNGRGAHLLYPSTASWKRAEIAAEIAGRAGRDLWLLGENMAVSPAAARTIGPLAGEAFYNELAGTAAVLSPIGTMATLEAAATGTPSIGLCKSDGWIEHGISGWLADSVQDAVEYVQRLDVINPVVARQWVADCRSIDNMAMWWEMACQRAADGERW
jgi:hypothetical protein